MTNISKHLRNVETDDGDITHVYTPTAKHVDADDIKLGDTRDTLQRDVPVSFRKKFARRTWAEYHKGESAWDASGSPQLWTPEQIRTACEYFDIDPSLYKRAQGTWARMVEARRIWASKGDDAPGEGSGASDGGDGPSGADSGPSGADVPVPDAPDAGDDDAWMQDKAEELASRVAEELASKVDEKVKDIRDALWSDIQEEIAKHTAPQHIEVSTDGGEPIEVDGLVHEDFPEALQYIEADINAVALIGPTGCGKTHMVEQVAEAIDARRFASISCSRGMDESHLLGRMLPTGDNMKFEYHPSPFIDVAENGGVFLFDEFDAVNENVALIINSALSNGYISIPERVHAPMLNIHENFICFFSMNTVGKGADRKYVGRSVLDDASVDRFRLARIEMDYDRNIESSLIPNRDLLERGWEIRDKVRELSLEHSVSTRWLIHSYKMLATHDDWDIPRCVDKLTMDWSDTDKSKVGL